VKPPADAVQAGLLATLWVLLFLALVAGLLIHAHLTGVASNYQKALRVGYKDALVLLEQGQKVKDDPNEEVQVADPAERTKIKSALDQALYRADAATRCANFSFWMFGLASVALGVLGFYGTVWKQRAVDASTAVTTSTAFIQKHYRVADADT